MVARNRQVYMFSNETVTAGTASIAFQPNRETGILHGFPFAAAEVLFSGAPGTFEIDIQVADTDDPRFYTTFASITSVNSSNVGRVQIPAMQGTYFRAYVNTLPNAVTTTLKFAR